MPAGATPLAAWRPLASPRRAVPKERQCRATARSGATTVGELLLVAFLGGLITGLSPCIVPVIPVVVAGGSTGPARRPYLIIAGLVVSFSLTVLFATTVLSFLHLPGDLLFWLGIALLGAISIGLLIPPIGELIERPFARLGSSRYATEGGGFVLGLSLGLVFVPCAGPVLTAISVAGEHNHVGFSAAVRHAVLRDRGHPAAAGAGRRGPAGHDELDVPAPAPADGPPGRRRPARRGDAGHRLQLAGRSAARRARVHHGARGPHRVEQFGLHPAARAERRAPEPIRRGQRPARGQEGDVFGDRRRQHGERPLAAGTTTTTTTSTGTQHHRLHGAREDAGVHGQQDQPAQPSGGPRTSPASRPGSTPRATSP